MKNRFSYSIVWPHKQYICLCRVPVGNVRHYVGLLYPTRGGIKHRAFFFQATVNRLRFTIHLFCTVYRHRNLSVADISVFGKDNLVPTTFSVRIILCVSLYKRTGFSLVSYPYSVRVRTSAGLSTVLLSSVFVNLLKRDFYFYCGERGSLVVEGQVTIGCIPEGSTKEECLPVVSLKIQTRGR